jgi:hypothetical protein
MAAYQERDTVARLRAAYLLRCSASDPHPIDPPIPLTQVARSVAIHHFAQLHHGSAWAGLACGALAPMRGHRYFCVADGALWHGTLVRKNRDGTYRLHAAPCGTAAARARCVDVAAEDIAPRDARDGGHCAEARARRALRAAGRLGPRSSGPPPPAWDPDPDGNVVQTVDRDNVRAPRVCLVDEPPENARLRRWRVRAKIGQGAYSQVFSAVHADTLEACAAKVLRPVSDARVARELRVLRALQGFPGVVRLVAVGRAAAAGPGDAGPGDAGPGDASGPNARQGDGPYRERLTRTPCVLTELLPCSLADTAPAGVDDALWYASRLLEALAALHGAGVAHRDLKPSNILIDPTPGRRRLRVIDWGLASEDGGTPSTARCVGTPAWRAPELLAGGLGLALRTGEPRAAPVAADLWSAGAVLACLLVASARNAPGASGGSARLNSYPAGGEPTASSGSNSQIPANSQIHGGVEPDDGSVVGRSLFCGRGCDKKEQMLSIVRLLGVADLEAWLGPMAVADGACELAPPARPPVSATRECLPSKGGTARPALRPASAEADRAASMARHAAAAVPEPVAAFVASARASGCGEKRDWGRSALWPRRWPGPGGGAAAARAVAAMDALLRYDPVRRAPAGSALSRLAPPP